MSIKDDLRVSAPGSFLWEYATVSSQHRQLIDPSSAFGGMDLPTQRILKMSVFGKGQTSESLSNNWLLSKTVLFLRSWPMEPRLGNYLCLVRKEGGKEPSRAAVF